MAGIVNQRDIELVFEDLTNAEVKKMSEKDREAARKFHLAEAARFGEPEYHEDESEDESEDEDEDEEVSRYHIEPNADSMRECNADLREENAEIAEMNSLTREFSNLMKERNTLTKERKCLDQEWLAAEKEWGELLRKESPKTDTTKDTEIERLWSEVQRLESEAETMKEASRTPWWRMWWL